MSLEVATILKWVLIVPSHLYVMFKSIKVTNYYFVSLKIDMDNMLFFSFNMS